MKALLDSDLACCLALWRQPYVGPKRMQKLFSLNPDFRVWFRQTASWELSRYLDPRSLKTPFDWKGVEQDLQWLSASSTHHIILLSSKRYPQRLKEIADPPFVLFVKGDASILSLAQIAMVGSRHPSATGFEDAYAFAKTLAAHGLVVTSGLASGVDTASHKGALDSGGFTIAVLGHGLDQIYPKSNQMLSERIIENGALISEFPIGVEIKPEFFPKRNRLISGLSMGVFVVEAALKSGSLITANYALEQGREVFAMPGSIHNPLAKGCNNLIRQGAKCVDKIEHLLEELQHLLHVSSYEPKAPFTQDAEENLEKMPVNQLLLRIDYACTPIDSIIERTGLGFEALSAALLEMELDGSISSVPGGYIRNVR